MDTPDTPRRRATDHMSSEEQQRQAELDRVAAMAARSAAELVNTAAVAAQQVTATAASTAHVLAESTRIDLGYIKADIAEIKGKLDNKFVTREAFEPIKLIVFGLVGLILTSVVGAIVALVLIKGGTQ